MRGSLTQEAQDRPDCKVAGHLSPHILELVVFGPAIGAGLLCCIALCPAKLGCASDGRIAHVIGVGEHSELRGLTTDGSGK